MASNPWLKEEKSAYLGKEERNNEREEMSILITFLSFPPPNLQ